MASTLLLGSGCIIVDDGVDTYSSCVVDADCAFASDICEVASGARICTQPCASDFDCPSPGVCGFDGYCALATTPLANTYDECTVDDDCATLDDICLSLASSTVSTGICSRSCSDSLDCPTTSSGFEPLCLSTGSGFFCVETCGDSLDCASGFSCEVIDSGDTICVPR